MKTNRLRPVIVRSQMAGVHYGYLVARFGRTVHLTLSRRIWAWEGAKTLSHIAVSGVSTAKLGEPVDNIVFDICECITCEPAAAKILDEAKPWR